MVITIERQPGMGGRSNTYTIFWNGKPVNRDGLLSSEQAYQVLLGMGQQPRQARALLAAGGSRRQPTPRPRLRLGHRLPRAGGMS